ncbi:ribonuclease HI family protein [Patescibacteria group bacterium]|nr:ribonuclease HI family protein [Patescibacteria group bacterium]
MYAKIFTDGGARGNPGPAGIGVVIEIEGKQHKYEKFIGHATNNQAEYQAVIYALERAKALGATEVDIFMDSELVESQLNQKFKIKNEALGPLFVQVWNLSLGFKKVRYFHLRRHDNKIADGLVNKAIDENNKSI